MRSCYYAANKEREIKKWYADNIYCEVSAYLESNKYAIVNNSSVKQDVTVYNGEGIGEKMILEPAEIKWMKI